MRKLVCALAVLLILSACGRDAEPTPTPPQAPALVSENSAEGAEAFVRHYIDTLNFARDSGDIKGLQFLSNSECENCAQIISTISRVHDSGGRYVGGDWNVISTKIKSSDWDMVVTVDGHFEEETVINKRGSEPTSVPAEDLIVDFQLQFDADSWTVLAFSTDLVG